MQLAQCPTSATFAAGGVNNSGEAKAGPESCQRWWIVATETTSCILQVQLVCFSFLWSEKGGVPLLKNEKPLGNWKVTRQQSRHLPHLFVRLRTV